MSWLTERLAAVVAPWTDTPARLHDLETRMTSAESAAFTRAAEVVGLIKAEFASLRQQVAEAATAGAAALEADAQTDADRINGLIDELVTVLPADVPEVPVPEPGAPAELPVDPAPSDPEPVPADESDLPPAA